MKYISIDIETSGLDPINNQILSIGAILEDTENLLPFDEIPKYHVAILEETIVGSPFALHMNRELIGHISSYISTDDLDEKNDLIQMTGMQFLSPDRVVKSLYDFVFESGYFPLSKQYEPIKITVAGKNFGTLDKLFLEELPDWDVYFKIRQRLIDPSILFVDWKTDKTMPSLFECKKRAGISGNVTHNALEDAWDVIQILRTTYKN